jgi:hypothetical protein
MQGAARTTSLIPLAALLLSVGCAEHLHLVTRGVLVGGPPISFWPPPEATSTWSDAADAIAGRSLGEAADRIAAALRSGGYDDQRWYAIGARYAHGFVVTTRLERVQDDGAPHEAGGRWSSRFPEASNLLWLEGARRARLPGAGCYRVLLVTLTDLPVGATRIAQRRSELTWMVERPDVPSAELPPTRRASADYRVGVYVYDYAADAPDGEGALLSCDEAPSAGLPAPAMLLGPQLRPCSPAPL